MCGICGILVRNDRGFDPVAGVAAMSQCLAHRGPDDSSFRSSGDIHLGMRRLSIIDVEHGQQPFVDAASGNILIANGEIYNHNALRDSLKFLGQEFRSRSDIEVILYAYEKYGLDCVKLLNGMFAFALWDNAKSQLILARDRFGIKPLFYSSTPGHFAFSSELRSLLKCPGVSRELDLISLNQYLSFDYVPSPRTICSGVSRLPAGCYAVVTKNNVEVTQYWEAEFAMSESHAPLDTRDYEQHFATLFEEAVSQEMVADVPVGVFLSGGIDSASILAAASARRSDISTFSVRFEDTSFDESHYARLVANRFASQHHEISASNDDCLQVARNCHELMDEPLADSSFVPTYILSKFASSRVKVALGGDGGDELFAGYPTHVGHRIIELYERLVPYFARANVVPKLMQLLPVSLGHTSLDFKMRRFLKGRGVPLSIRHHRWMGALDDEGKQKIIHPNLHFEFWDTYEAVRRLVKSSDARTAGNLLLFLDLKLYLEGDILAKVDRASMRNSLEVRVPFLNRSIADFILQLPYNLKLHYFTSKYFLKRTFRSRLPKEIIQRKKKGFNFPVGKLLKDGLRADLEETLSSAELSKHRLFSDSGIRELIDSHTSGRTDESKALWNLFVFQRWFAAHMN